jgi:hypothetical protein
MKVLKTYAFIICVSFFMTSTAFAAQWEYKGSTFDVSFMQQWMEYKEDIDAPMSTKESGDVPGIRASYSYRWPNEVYFNAMGELASGSTKCEGTAEDGTPVSSYTGDNITRWSATLGYTTWPISYFTVTPVIGYGQYQWNRQLSGETPYDMKYSVNYLPVGMLIVFEPTSRFQMDLYGEWRQAINGEIKVSLNDWSGKGSMNTHYGYRFELGAMYRLGQLWGISASGFYDYMHLSSSEEFLLGDSGITMSMPSSATKTIGATIGLCLTF